MQKKKSEMATNLNHKSNHYNGNEESSSLK